MNKKTKNALLSAVLVLIIFVIDRLQTNGFFPNQEPVIGVVSTSTMIIDTKIASSSREYFVVTRVVDGDTIELENGSKVRYIGVNTPESVDPRRPVQCFGKEASKYNKELVENKKIRLEKDVSDVDRYGRLLRFVYLEDGTFVNLKLVNDGYASAATYPPDVRFANLFKNAEKSARDMKLGLWGMCQ